MHFLEQIKTMSLFAQDMLAKGFQEGFQEAFQEALLESELRGKRQGAIDMLLRQLMRRFGDLSPWVHEQVNGAQMEMLRLWGDRVLDASSLIEVFGVEPPDRH